MGISRLSMKWLGLLVICTMAGPVSRAQWVKASINTYGYSMGSIAVLDSTVLVPVVANGFLCSTDQGVTWTSSSALASIFVILVVYDCRVEFRRTDRPDIQKLPGPIPARCGRHPASHSHGQAPG